MMIKSMTGYGSFAGEAEGLKLNVELKSVNNRYLDVSVHIPRNFIFVEEGLKSAVSRYVSRGKIDIFISIDGSKSSDMTAHVNMPLAESYLAAITELSERFGLERDITAKSLSRFPDVLQLERIDTDKEAVADALCRMLENALTGFEEMRLREGSRMREDMLERIEEIERLCLLVEERSPKTVADYRRKLEQRMRDVLESTDIDENRIMLEAAIFADRVSVNEETVRLRSHIHQMRPMLDGDSPIGRKLDFLIQELNREVNTIGSKGNDAEVSRIVVDMKAEIEKIREQAQNIE